MITKASSSGKAILFGEHAVVYGYPAIAVPLHSLRATAEIISTSDGTHRVIAKDLGLSHNIIELPTEDPFRYAIELFFSHTGIQSNQGLQITLSSDIPIASGMGSGAAIQTALMKALHDHFLLPYTSAELSELVYQIEKIYHGNPSGIDNTVTCYEQPILFRKESGIDFLEFPHPFHLVIGNSGHSTPTRTTVSAVRTLFEEDRTAITHMFEQIKEASQYGLAALQSGDWKHAGEYFTHNHNLLQKLTVSDTNLDQLVQAANAAGAFGAKLSGGGRGGIVIALVDMVRIDPVMEAMKQAGAVDCFTTMIGHE